MEFIKEITLDQWIIIFFATMMILNKVFNALGWKKGVLIIDEIREAVQDSRDLIMTAKNAANGTTAIYNINDASKSIAAKVEGLTEHDVQKVVGDLVKGSCGEINGVKLLMDSQGNISADFSNLATKYTRKLGKWVKKAF